ncbi:MAG: 4Fe-4S binding protein [Eggerthellaceae bacterium]
MPHRVIGGEVGDGFLRARTPKLNFHRGSCDFCGDCQRVCPTGAIGAFDPEADKMGMAVVQKDRCVAYYQGCVECQKACPFEAIELDGDGHPVVDADRCNGCGVCEDVCPALVYRSFSGGTRRGIVVVSPSAYARLGKTVVEDESEMSA